MLRLMYGIIAYHELYQTLIQVQAFIFYVNDRKVIDQNKIIPYLINLFGSLILILMV